MTDEEKMLLGQGEGLNRQGEIVLGVGEGVGADEDDFMVAKRKFSAMEKEDAVKKAREKIVKKAKKQLEKQTIGSMAHSQSNGEEREKEVPNVVLGGEPEGMRQEKESSSSPAPAKSTNHPALATLANRKKPKVVAF